jgi:hypothetical protein
MAANLVLNLRLLADLCSGKTCAPTAGDVCKASGTCNMFTGICTDLPDAADGTACTENGKSGKCLSGSCGECYDGLPSM